MTEKHILQLNHVSLTYHTLRGETLALKDISFGIQPSEFISIVGPSGCGKTTILSLIAGLLTKTSGDIYLQNDPITKTNKNVGYMFQRDELFDWLTIEENILLGLTIQKKRTPENKKKAQELIVKYGLDGFQKSYPRELSGGMRQRVALIRTLATNPHLLLLDEPFSALDYQTRLNVQNSMHAIIKSEHKTAILVTHDISEAIAMSDRVLILTKRPATLKKEITISLPQNLTPFERRNHPEFQTYFLKIWEELQDEEENS